MATTEEILEVLEMLGPDAVAGGWDESRVGVDLESGKSLNEIAFAWWSYRAANTVNLTSISESGSSRQLSEIHTNAVRMRDYWKGLVDADKAPVVEAPTGYGRGIRLFSIRRGTL